MGIFIKLYLWNVLEICNYFILKFKPKQLLGSCSSNKLVARNRGTVWETLITHLGCAPPPIPTVMEMTRAAHGSKKVCADRCILDLEKPV